MRPLTLCSSSPLPSAAKDGEVFNSARHMGVALGEPDGSVLLTVRACVCVRERAAGERAGTAVCTRRPPPPACLCPSLAAHFER